MKLDFDFFYVLGLLYFFMLITNFVLDCVFAITLFFRKRERRIRQAKRRAIEKKLEHRGYDTYA